MSLGDMATSRTLRFYDANIKASSLTGEITQLAAPAPLGSAVGRASDLVYDAVGNIVDPEDPLKTLEFHGQVSFRTLAGVNFLSAPVGSPCKIRVDLAVNPPVAILYAVSEVFLFDPCDAGATGNPMPPIVNIEPADPVRPVGPIGEEPI